MIRKYTVANSNNNKKTINQYDVVVCLTEFSKAHTNTRKEFSEKGGRFLSIPMPDIEILKSKAMETNFQSLRYVCNHLLNC